MTRLMEDILKLSVQERIQMVEAIWDSIADQEDNFELNSNTKKLLNERLKSHVENPEAGASWEDVKARIKKQL